MTAPIIYHGTPITPAAALRDVCSGRALCVSFYRPDQVAAALEISPAIMFDNGAFSFWMQAKREGLAFAAERDWSPFFDWLELRLFHPGRWAVIPDMPGAPPAMNDALVAQWPFGQAGAPIWHMDGPIERLLQLASAFGRICLAWTGERVGCDSYRRRMDDVAAALGIDQGFDHSIIDPALAGAVVCFCHNDQLPQLLPLMAGQFHRFALLDWTKAAPQPVANKHYRPDREFFIHAWNRGYHPQGALADKARSITASPDRGLWAWLGRG